MAGELARRAEQLRTAEVIAALSLATDLGMGFPLEHGLHSTIVAIRLARQLGVDVAVEGQAYYGCLLGYVGCTADAEVAAGLFGEGVLLKHFTPVMFGSPVQTLTGIVRALGGADGGSVVRAYRGITRLPRAARGHRQHVVALCEVAEMLTQRLGVPADVTGVVSRVTERWDGKGEPAHLRSEEIPLATRIVQVARDATFHHMLGGPHHAAGVIRERAGRAFDPAVAAALVDAGPDLLSVDATDSLWDQTLAIEPGNSLCLDADAIDRALAAMGDFADLLSPYLAGHSSGVAELATAAARRGFPDDVVLAVRRAAYLHDIGRVAIAAHVWQKTTPLTLDERERIRLHPYYTERVLGRSPFLAALAPIATVHHERLDGSGYHRGAAAAVLAPPARLLAAADAYQSMTSPRPHRPALPPRDAASALRAEAGAGRLDARSVSDVLAAVGQVAGPVPRPAGLTDREAQVIGLVAHGLPTKRIAHVLGISAKTADRHIQNAYGKIGISSRAAAALFAMEHGLATWGELPIVREDRRS